MPWMRAASSGMVKPAGLIMKFPPEILFPAASERKYANCIILGQLARSVMGAFQFLGRPVVSVSKNRYMPVLCSPNSQDFPLLFGGRHFLKPRPRNAVHAL